jgi:ferredoxin
MTPARRGCSGGVGGRSRHVDVASNPGRRVPAADLPPLATVEHAPPGARGRTTHGAVRAPPVSPDVPRFYSPPGTTLTACGRPGSPGPVSSSRFERTRYTRLKVWIDQDLCTGDGLCEEIAPDVFTLLDDGLAYVKEGTKVFSDPGGAEGMAVVPAGQEEATIESAEECPGECIFIEVE